MILQNVTVSALRSFLQNTYHFHTRKESVAYPRHVQGMWGRLVEDIFVQILTQKLQPKDVFKYLQRSALVDFLLSAGVPQEYMLHFLTKELPEYIRAHIELLPSSSPAPQRWSVQLSEEYWIPDLLIITGQADCYYQLGGIHRILEVKSNLLKPPMWQIEDLVQTTLYSYLCVINNFQNPEKSYTVDIRPKLITGHYSLPMMTIYYPPAGYIASYFDFSKIKAVDMLLKQYHDYEIIDLTVRLPRSHKTLGDAFKENWIRVGALTEVSA